MGYLSKLKEGFVKQASFTLDLVSAVAKNPLSILSPVKSAEKIKELRTTGTQAERITYVKTTAVQTALNVGGALAAGGALGAAAAKTATTIGSKVITAGVITAPLIVGSSKIRETVAGFSPVESGVLIAEKIEEGVKKGEEKSITVAEIIGTLAAGGGAAAAVIGGKYLYDKWKDRKEEKTLETQTEMPQISGGAIIPTDTKTPTLPATQTITTGTGLTTKRKKRRSIVKQSPQNISQKVNVILNPKSYSVNRISEKYLKGRVF
jgi:hypothetical protein